MTPRNPLEVARKLLDKHGLQDWQFKFQRMSPPGTWGHCDYASKTIRIDFESCPPRQFRQTLLHEIAHALTPAEKEKHGIEWLKKAEEVGCTSAHLWPYYLALGESKRGGV